MTGTNKLVLLGGSIGVILLGVAWWRYRARGPRPLVIDDEAPAMKAARAKAKERIAEFVALYQEHPDDALIKWPFAISAGKWEYLDAKVLTVKGDEVSIRLLSPPVAAAADLERDRIIRLDEVADWIVTLPDGQRKGGFTTLARFELAKKEWGGLPDELMEEEQKFADPSQS